MGKYRKKPVVIEAVRFDDKFLSSKQPVWIETAMFDYVIEVKDNASPKHLTIRTIEGIMRCNPGDWIIRGVNGELYPCKHDIFEKTYESAE